jgi:hypothetical protein
MRRGEVMVYRHWKGGAYEKLFDALNTDTPLGGDMRVVVYKQIGTGTIFVRKHDDFHGEVEVEGTVMPRFRLMSPEEALKALFDSIDENRQKLPKNAPELASEHG